MNPALWFINSFTSAEDQEKIHKSNKVRGRETKRDEQEKKGALTGESGARVADIQ